MSRVDRLLSWRAVAATLIVVDAVAVGLAVSGAYEARFRLQLVQLVPGVEPASPWFVFPVFIAVSLLAFLAFGLYRMSGVGSGYEEYRRVAVACTASAVALITISYVDERIALSRGFLVVAWISSVGLVCGARFLVRRLVRHLARRGLRLRRLLVVGANQQAIAIAHEMESATASSYVCGFLDEYRTKGELINGHTVLGEPMALYETATEIGATHALVVESALSWESLRFVIRSMHYRRTPEILLAPGMFDVSATPLHLSQLGSVLLLVPQASRIVGVEALLKRLVDLTIAVPTAIITLPAQAIIWLWLRLEGREPLVWQRVRGQGGTLMRLPSFDSDGLRSLHLSRLPYIWWVVAGLVSLVGPRPLVASEADRFEPWADVLNALKPGLLGPWWLVSSEPMAVEKEIEADLRYARSYTFWMDLLIFCRVALALLQRRAVGRQVSGRQQGAERAGSV
jgi:lipopolysaccharide/colanic/teichoic acid biosynthesis glycosyltransferase